jgi:hypothetical protein
VPVSPKLNAIISPDERPELVGDWFEVGVGSNVVDELEDPVCPEAEVEVV